ncbi:MAG: hypothetical protein NDI62_00315 [Burkholderiales bacterium]|nr:hypothetical protein [Burkholderiales bacterium]
MKKLELEIFHKLIGIFLIILGLISYIFPIPGSTLLVALGFVWLVGKEKTLSFLRMALNKKIFRSLKIDKLIKDI